MSRAERFEDLRVWQEARALVRAINFETRELRDFVFRDQIRGAALSAMNNIAEGFERNSDADFARFLDIAKGSSGEVRSMLYVAEDETYLSPLPLACTFRRTPPRIRMPLRRNRHPRDLPAEIPVIPPLRGSRRAAPDFRP